MPNGVICDGALDGSNHAGAIVTCQATTASPGDDACAAGADETIRVRSPATRTARPYDRIMSGPLGEAVTLPAALGDRRGELLEHRHRRLPAHARIRDALSVDEARRIFEVLAPVDDER